MYLGKIQAPGSEVLSSDMGFAVMTSGVQASEDTGFFRLNNVKRVACAFVPSQDILGEAPNKPVIAMKKLVDTRVML